MAFSIQTNVSSLIAQENLRVNNDFQSQTIQRLTSGYRINQSGDDAAGLAIANKFRSDVTELTQGVRNANDGISQLQIMDGGMNNIGKMLDRLKTLATQSASSTFTGDRSVLNKEYQTLVKEIDRQAQSIGLSKGARFAKTMGVYIGGGTTAGGASDTGNGTVTLDLSSSAVDSRALGLRTSEFKAQTATGVNLASASKTSIASIVSANSGDSGKATFELSGPGFASTSISVTLTTSDTTSTVADKLNSAIQAAGNSGTDAANMLRDANIQVKAVTDSNGNEQLSFTSATTAFQVSAGTNTANALMGYFDASATNAATGASVSQTVTATTAMANGVAAGHANDELVSLKVFVDGVAKDLSVQIAGGDADRAAVLAKVTGATGYSALSALGVTAEINDDGKLQFVGNSNQTIEVQASGDTNNYLGFGAWREGSQVIGAGNVTVGVDAAVDLTVTINGTAVTLAGIDTTGDATTADMLGDITAHANYSQLQELGVTARLVDVGANKRLVFEGNAGQTITVSAGATDAGNLFGLNTTTANAGTIQPGAAFNAGASGNTATMAFSINGGDKILVSFTSDGTTAGAATALQAAIDGNTELKAAGLQVSTTTFAISAQNTGVDFRAYVESQSGTLNLGLGTGSSSAASFAAASDAGMLTSSGASQTGLGNSNDVFSFAGLKNVGGTGGTLGAGADQQVLSFSATDSGGVLQSVSVTLSSSNAYDVDKAVEAINNALQDSGNSTLKQIVAVKETNSAGTAEGIRFISSLNGFSVNVGQCANYTDATPVGLYDGTAGASSTQGMTVDSSASGTIDISSAAGAKEAVVALGQAVQKLGSAQAAVGKGQNQLNYAVNLAQSQISNYSAAESRIRDADIASEAANLTKAQVLQKTSIAAMAQANSAPQAVLSLLQG
jgi:flagellin